MVGAEGPVEGDLRTWRGALTDTERRLHASPAVSDDDAAREARWLVEEAACLSGAALAAAGDRDADPAAVARLDDLVARRLTGEPLQYVLGHWPFRTLDLLVDRRVLIPRPETEVVCELALREVDRLAATHAMVQVVDLGTGSGALALSLAAERGFTEVWAVERSAAATTVARANLERLGHGAERVHVVEGSWFAPLPAELQGCVHVVVANPPYVGAHEALPPSVEEWEPLDALRPFAGAIGLESIEAILGAAPAWLAADGAVVIEIGETQSDAATALARAAGLVAVTVQSDLARRPRVLTARRAPA